MLFVPSRYQELEARDLKFKRLTWGLAKQQLCAPVTVSFSVLYILIYKLEKDSTYSSGLG